MTDWLWKEKNVFSYNDLLREVDNWLLKEICLFDTKKPPETSQYLFAKEYERINTLKCSVIEPVIGFPSLSCGRIEHSNDISEIKRIFVLYPKITEYE